MHDTHDIPYGVPVTVDPRRRYLAGRFIETDDPVTLIWDARLEEAVSDGQANVISVGETTEVGDLELSEYQDLRWDPDPHGPNADAENGTVGYDPSGENVTINPGIDAPRGEFDSAEAETFSTDETDTGRINSDRVVGEYGDGSIADALSDLPTWESPRITKSERSVLLPPGEYNESVTIDTHHVEFAGRAQSSHIIYEGEDHAFTIDGMDVFPRNIQVDHNGGGSGDEDAIHFAPGNEELMAVGLTTDAAPRYGINVQSNACHLTRCEIAAGGVAGLNIEEFDVQATHLKMTGLPADGVHLNVGGDSVIRGARVSGYITAPDVGVHVGNCRASYINIARLDSPTVGFKLDADAERNILTGVILMADQNAIEINGLENHIHAIAVVPSNNAAVFQSNAKFNTLTGYFTGPIVFEEGSQENVVNGTHRREWVENGSRNLVNGRGRNEGDPRNTGAWNGEAYYAMRNNAIIEDTVNDNLYAPLSDGAWSQIG